MLRLGKNVPANGEFREILELERMLIDAKIPHIIRRLCDGWQICYPNNDNYVLSAIEFTGSYGSKNDLIEIMGLLNEKERDFDSVCGNLPAKNVFERIKNHYNQLEKEQQNDGN